MSVQLLTGDVLGSLALMADETVHCVVTSPPYWGLRDYGVEGQIGLEPTIDEYVAKMIAVFAEVRRVMRDDATLWLNLGDSYFRNPAKGGSGPDGKEQSYFGDVYGRAQGANSGQGNNALQASGLSRRVVGEAGDIGSGKRAIPVLERGRNDTPLKEKDLCMIPARVALALQADGWWLRSEIVWAKPNPMPESVTDRPTSAHEKIFLLSKSQRYFYDAEAVREADVTGDTRRPYTSKGAWELDGRVESQRHGGEQRNNPVSGRNLRNVWNVATQPYSEAHFATFAPKLIEPCIKAGTSEKGVCAACGAPWVREVETTKTESDREARGKGLTSPRNDGNAWNENDGRGFVPTDVRTTGWSPSCGCDADVVPATVLDIFGGAGTTGLVADRLNRDAILIEINPEYADMAQARIHNDAPLFVETMT